MGKQKEIINSVDMKLILIEPGTFMMGLEGPIPMEGLQSDKPGKNKSRRWYGGDSKGDYDEAPRHKVTITQPQ
jgi:formylglycine-generating enzyme required for sulfatase activity